MSLAGSYLDIPNHFQSIDSRAMENGQDDREDFAMPPAKRRRTESPTDIVATTDKQGENIEHTAATTVPNTVTESPSDVEAVKIDLSAMPVPGLDSLDVQTQSSAQESTREETESDMLDMLMQHVESTSEAHTLEDSGGTVVDTQKHTSADEAVLESHSAATKLTNGHPSTAPTVEELERETMENADNGQLVPEIQAPAPPEKKIAPEATMSIANTAGLDVTATEAAVEGAEWEVDSSPIESSSDSDTSTDISDDSDDDADEDYAMLDPEEQARILMAGDGGSDDEGEGKQGDKGEKSQLRTANEKPEEIIPMPQIEITPEMKVVELGTTQGFVESTVLILGKVSGEYQVLEGGSLLCSKDRKPVGVVADTLGRVEQPMYTIRFTNDAAIEEAGLNVNGTGVYYVEPHSAFVLTQPLKGIKGSDASNIHDEEVGAQEMEFSDDEAEAEYKRSLKLKKQGRREGNEQRGRGSFRGNRGRPDVTHTHDGGDRSAYSNGAMEMNYDDVADGMDDGYTPLVRPSSMHGEVQPHQSLSSRGSDDFRGRGRGRGQDFRGRGRGRGRGDRGRGNRGRGDYSANTSHSSPNVHNGYNQGMPPPQSYGQSLYGRQQPHQPDIPPSNQGYAAFSPSPISPLPQSFNFNAHQQQSQIPQPGTHINPAFWQAFQQQFQVQQNYSQPQQQQQTYGSGQNGYSGSWQGNEAAAEQVRRQLEEMRRNSGG